MVLRSIPLSTFNVVGGRRPDKPARLPALLPDDSGPEVAGDELEPGAGRIGPAISGAVDHVV